MHAQRWDGWIDGLSLALVLGIGLVWASPVSAQTFSSGSTGADGAFAPMADTTLGLPPDGVLNFTTVTIPAGVTVTVARNAANTPVTLLASGDVSIVGTLSLNGSIFTPGPGGFAGAIGGASGNLPGEGLGPGGGAERTNATYGAPSDFLSLLPLFGGSGGGGGGTATSVGGLGGGGGGAIVIASSTRITITGTITANGGPGTQPLGGCASHGGNGSGGAIRLVAPVLAGTGGSLTARGGIGNPNCRFAAGNGRIRVERFSASGLSLITTPPASISVAPGPVTAASNPALVNLPTLTFSAVGGVVSPEAPGASYTTADIALPQGATNPVPITLTATHTPVGTVFTVRVIPQFGAAITVNTTPSTGTFETSTATASVNFPTGQVSVLQALADFTLPQLASLYPFIDGGPVGRVMVAAAYGEPSTVTLIATSGKALPADHVFRSVR